MSPPADPIEKLSTYYDFDPDVIEAVSRAQHSLSQQSQQALADGPDKVYPTETSKYPVDTMEFNPSRSTEYDPSFARVLHLPMANPISPNMAYRAARLYEADPTKRLIVFGNPCSLVKPTPGSVSLKDARIMHATHSLVPVAEPTLRVLSQRGVSSSDQLGYSYGSDKAATVAGIADKFDHEVQTGVFAEPASIERQPVIHLFQRFMSAGKTLQAYIDDTQDPVYKDIRKADTPLSGANYLAGLARPTNLAIANVIAAGGFGRRIRAALNANPLMRATIAYGNASELVNDQYAEGLVEQLRGKYGGRRISQLVLRGMTHAGADNINLHAAIMLQGIKNARRV